MLQAIICKWHSHQKHQNQHRHHHHHVITIIFLVIFSTSFSSSSSPYVPWNHLQMTFPSETCPGLLPPVSKPGYNMFSKYFINTDDLCFFYMFISLLTSRNQAPTSSVLNLQTIYMFCGKCILNCSGFITCFNMFVKRNVPQPCPKCICFRFYFLQKRRIGSHLFLISSQWIITFFANSHTVSLLIFVCKLYPYFTSCPTSSMAK